MKKITLSDIVSAAALVTVAMTAQGAHGAVLNYQFETTLNDGFFVTGAPEIDVDPNPDFIRGAFSFNDSALTGVGFESLGTDDGLQIALTEDPRVTEGLDPRAPDFPTVNFQDGELIGLDWFAVYHPFTAVAELNYPGDFIDIKGDQVNYGFDPTFYTPQDEPRQPILGTGTVEYTLVPEPTMLLGIATSALSFSALRRRKTRPV